MTSIASQRWPRSHRLQGEQRFAAVYDARVRVGQGPLLVYALPNDLAHLRVGISISRRVGVAAARNRIKRLLRESFRLSQHDLPGGYDLVIVVKPHEPLSLDEYRQLIASITRKLDESWRKRRAV